MKLGPAVKGYVLATVALAGMALLYWGQPPRATVSHEYLLAALFAVLSAAALLHPLKLARGRKLTLASTVHLASLLLFGPLMAMLTVGASTLWANLTQHSRKRHDLWNVAFNTAQSIVGLALAGAVWEAAAGGPVAALRSAPDVLAVAGAAAVLYLYNTMAVAAAIALQHGEPVLPLWFGGRRRDILEAVTLYLYGAIAGLTVREHPWVLLVLLVPTLVVYQSLHRMVKLTDQAVAVVEALVDVVELRGHGTAEHSRRVADLAERLARAMRLPSEQVTTIRLAARVHDLGKVGLPDAVLYKPGPLTAQERWLMQRHPETGYQILSRFPELRDVAALVRAHHERYDGAGYPNARAGGEIPVGAHIIAVVDAFDAMTTDRPYRAAGSVEQALAVLRQEAGRQFDPAVVAALETLLRPAAPRLAPQASLRAAI